LGLSGLAVCALGSCNSTTTALIYTPVTGILIKSSELVEGHGCGTAPDQIYAYVAVLAYAASPNIPYTSIVVPCYSDGLFSNLQPDPDGGLHPYDYTLFVYAYNAQSFPPELACGPPNTTGGCPGDSWDAAVTASPDAGVEPKHAPNWTTLCHATEYLGIPVLADCRPLEPAIAAITIGTQAFPLSDGGTLTCHKDYDEVVASWNVEGDSGAGDAGGTATLPCPSPVVISPAQPGAAYAIDLGLVSNGAPDAEAGADAGAESGADVAEAGANVANVATVSCTATAVAGSDASASCAPAQLVR
jgi:hypothetical protein